MPAYDDGNTTYI